ncbi:MAG: cytochrome c biogenesis protein CcsA [Leptonema sp. (in: bacteria)]
MNLNSIGSILLVLSGVIVIFSFIVSFVGLSTRFKFLLFRSIIIDLFFKNNRIFRKKIYKSLLSVSRWFSDIVLNYLRITKLQASLLASKSLKINFFVSLIIVIVLVIQLAINDTTSKYVVSYSSESLSIFYRITALWAGSSGSLLFWYFLLNLFTYLFLSKSVGYFRNSISFIVLVLSSLQFIFIFLMLYYQDAQPFLQYQVPMQAGKGLNPLLLHWAMIIHPPILYIGYVSFSIPFAISIVMILSNRITIEAINLIRKWALVSWFFLGFGILLGSKWAYEELGWGGYWAWDPVENASLMPFLFATAFLHSLLTYKNRKMLKFWSFLLIFLTYHFCLLGTWITRSGVIEGPHSFAKSDIGYPLIFFIILSFLFFSRYFYIKRRVLFKEKKVDIFTSKEGTILISNFVMLISVLIILVGVFSPLLPLHCTFENGIECFKTEWKPTTYNKIMVPIGVLTLFLIGLSPFLNWRKPLELSSLKKAIYVSILGGGLYSIFYFFYLKPIVKLDNSPWGIQFIADAFSILIILLGIFSIYGIVDEFQKGIRYRKYHFKENFFQSFWGILKENQTRYGGYLVHLSVVFLFIGFSGGSYKTEHQIQFHYYLMQGKPNSDYIYYYSGDKAYLLGYVIEARELFIRPFFEPNADQSKPINLIVSQEAHFRVNPKNFLSVYTVSYGDPYQLANQPSPFLYRALKFTTGFILDSRMVTERRYYPQVQPYTGDLIRNQMGFAERLATSEPDIFSSWTEDFYIQVGIAYDPIRNRTVDFASMFEYYYYDLNKNDIAYKMIFPETIVLDLFIWINPLIKFIWLGMTLFFISGLLVLIPFKKN